MGPDSEKHVIVLKTYHASERCLVLEQADTSLWDALGHEQITSDPRLGLQVVEDVGRCLRKLHHLNIVHGDLKPRNVLRVSGLWKLTDLDASSKVGELAGLKFSSAFCPPEMWDLDVETGLQYCKH